MGSLFVLGNGFDLAHKFSTGFGHFRAWLCDNYGTSHSDELLMLPRFQTNYKRHTEYDENGMANLFYNMIESILGDNWSDFESTLSELDWAGYIQETVEDDTLISNYLPHELSDYASGIGQQLLEMSYILTRDLFAAWARQIDTSNPMRLSDEFKSILSVGKCAFLSFNYTDTLEQHYGATDVCHIHGRASQHDHLVVGHGNEYKRVSTLNDDDADDYMWDVYGYVKAICESYRKNTREALRTHASFFKGLTNISDVYFHGFSFSPVDCDYLVALSQYVDFKKITVHLHSYSKRKFPTFSAKLVALGVKPSSIVPFRLNDLPDSE